MYLMNLQPVCFAIVLSLSVSRDHRGEKTSLIKNSRKASAVLPASVGFYSGYSGFHKVQKHTANTEMETVCV